MLHGSSNPPEPTTQFHLVGQGCRGWSPWSTRSSHDVDVELLRSAEVVAVPSIHEQVVARGSGDEGRLRQLRLPHREGRVGRLSYAVDFEVPARRSRVVVVEEVQQAVAVGIVG